MELQKIIDTLKKMIDDEKAEHRALIQQARHNMGLDTSLAGKGGSIKGLTKALNLLEACQKEEE